LLLRARAAARRGAQRSREAVSELVQAADGRPAPVGALVKRCHRPFAGDPSALTLASASSRWNACRRAAVADGGSSIHIRKRCSRHGRRGRRTTRRHSKPAHRRPLARVLEHFGYPAGIPRQMSVGCHTWPRGHEGAAPPKQPGDLLGPAGGCIAPRRRPDVLRHDRPSRRAAGAPGFPRAHDGPAAQPSLRLSTTRPRRGTARRHARSSTQRSARKRTCALTPTGVPLRSRPLSRRHSDFGLLSSFSSPFWRVAS